MPFKSKKQKKTIDAAAHNPEFAKKVGIDVSAAKKMSKHGKGQTKFEEDRTEVKDKDGKVTSWRDETPWRKAQNKNGRGKVTNLSDKARRETEKMNKTEESVAGPDKCWPGHRKVGTKPGTGKNAGKRVNDCEKIDEALLKEFEEHIAEVKITSGPNKGKDWSPKNPGPTNKNYKEIDGNIPSPPDGATAPPPGYKPPQPKSTKDKRAEVTPSSDDAEMTAEAKQTYGGKGKQMTKSEHDADVKKKKEKEKMKKMAEAFIQIGRLEQMIFEAKKTKKKEEEPKEGNAFGKAVSDAKKDGIQKGEKVKVGGKEIPVKESNKEKECNHTPKGKKCPVHGVKECGMYEGNDGNLANNAKPYDKVTRGDVVAGRLGKDEMGGKKKKKVKEETGEERDLSARRENDRYDNASNYQGRNSRGDVIRSGGEVVKGNPNPPSMIQKVAGKLGLPNTATDALGDPMYKSSKPKIGSGGSGGRGGGGVGGHLSDPSAVKSLIPNFESKQSMKEGWTHDSLAAKLFESGDEYVVSLHNKLAKQLKG